MTKDRPTNQRPIKDTAYQYNRRQGKDARIDRKLHVSDGIVSMQTTGARPERLTSSGIACCQPGEPARQGGCAAVAISSDQQ